MRAIIFVAAAVVALSACASNPGGGPNLSETGKVALQEIATIAVRRAVNDSPRAAEKARNIREVAVRLQAFTALTTIDDLKGAVSAEVDKLGLNAVDRADAQSLLNIFAALLVDYLGTRELNADALVRVGEFAAMIVAALPPAA